MFSVVIPLYNKEATIYNTIQTVLNQEFGYFEIIVIDDGSTDGSVETVKAIKDDRINIISISNGGVSNARNIGVNYSKYEYVAFLDADDLWDSLYLLEINNLISRYPNCGLYASGYRIEFQNKSVVVGENYIEGVVDNVFKSMLFDNIIWTSACVVRKSVFEIVGGFPVGMITGEDHYMWTKVASEFNVVFCPRTLATYMRVHSGISYRYNKKDSCNEKWQDLLSDSDFYKNEFIAKVALWAGIRYAFGNFKFESMQIERTFSYTKFFRRRYRILYLLNRLPVWAISIFELFFSLYKKVKKIN